MIIKGDNMVFTELTKEEFKKFLDNHELKSYLQTPEMAQLKVLSGWEEYYVGVKKDDKILCATMMIAYKGKLGKQFSAPRGYLIDFRDKDLLAFFTQNIKKYIKKQGGFVLNIEPKILYKERDIDGKIVDGGFDNSDIYDNLVELGYKHGGFYDHLNLNKQVRWAFALSIKNKTEEEIFEGFKPNTRNIIRKALKCGVTVRELAYDELDKFVEIVESSGSRKNFHSRSLKYYQRMYDLFHDNGDVKFLVTELDMDKYIKSLEDDKIMLEKKIIDTSDTNVNKRKINELKSQVSAADDRIGEAKELKNKYGNKAIMAGAMFMLYGDEIVYLFSGTRTDFMTLKSQYLLQWDIMKYGIKNGYSLHNFYGINGRIEKDDDRYGVYTFKRSFGGTVIEYIGDFDLVIDPLKYVIHKIISKIKQA